MDGSSSIQLLSDGAVKFDGGVLFGQIPKGIWQEWMVPDRRNRVKLGLNCLLVTIGSKNYLVDTGGGQKLSSSERDLYGLTGSSLITSLRNHGLTPQDIDGVILSSLQFEHTGGCTKRDRKGDLVPSFPKATYYVQKSAFDEAMYPNERNVGSFVQDDFYPLDQKGVLKLLDGDTQIVPGIQVRKTGGPSIGHQICLITHGGEWVAYLGDLIPTHFHLQLPCISSNDKSPEETLNSKRSIMMEAASDGWLLIFSHGTDSKSGYLELRNGRSHLRRIDLSH